MNPNLVIHKGWLELLNPLAKDELKFDNDYIETEIVKGVLYQGYQEGNSIELIKKAIINVSPLTFSSYSLLAFSANNINNLVYILTTYSVYFGSPMRLINNKTANAKYLEVLVRNAESRQVEITYLGQIYYVTIVIRLMLNICPKLKGKIKLQISYFPFDQATKYQFEELLGCVIEVRQGLMKICIERVVLNYQIKTRDLDVYDALLPVVIRKSQRMSSVDIIQKCYDFLDEQETLLMIDNDSLAKSLSITSRTLNRRLNQIHTNYRELIDKYRYERAQRLLESNHKNITLIAYELGYVDVSSFTRAFKRWSGGVTPSMIN
ncbi:helix-turn-helix domain-containing protein [Aliivibrio fischeri]|uniref:Transcriptional regulator, AraC family protein n=1 Tax=Aliivibrio fischeri SR5 TaxID=1088719 RepID=A0AAV3EQ44_ALIFS|nr:helix-turn-helix domain-containing protein [Aliivibrio fischeri]EHN69086.1 transcriptional regulator, AraC family protein [Aliivibrio fischeri SR5]MUK27886.1 helix-turn-helix domain-containing protein [Aliivibrio fischeri]MUK34852.1 helix-turn-helix domain-containing protein [Aliivibrio fischeri]OCH02671.1 AraC family transcriptional regulator [Aliivibrio fischeri]OCH58955.1 AraC family transcriptional regulator [Aliivibrio fischeri]